VKKIILSLFLIISVFCFGNSNHINYIRNNNPKLTEEEAKKIYEILENNSKKYNVDINLVLAVASVESKFRHTATSSAGAYGIMQIMPKTAEHYKVDRKKIDENIEAGVKHLRDSIDIFGNNDYAVASYNAGISRIKNTNYRNIPETRYYVAKVSQELKKLGSGMVAKNNETMLEKYKKGEAEIKKLKQEIAFLRGENEQLKEGNIDLNNNTEDIELKENLQEESEKIEQQEEKRQGLGFKMGGLSFDLNK
jgi:lytic transglycosylase catalytic